jgi:crotonobetainyl-CoA:carnitine CoA-transferase CaiB-like acyl-CoA transferase
MNKKSVTLDLRTHEGKAALERLVLSAEVVLNNLRGDLPAKMGLDYTTLSKLKPSIVCVHLSAYGRDNERALVAGLRLPDAGRGGLMHLTGEPDGPPTRIGAPSMIDHTTGLTAMVGLLAALVQARATGKGCDVDTCLFDAALHQLGYAAIWYLKRGLYPRAPDALGALLGGARADLPDQRRLDLRDVPHRQVLNALLQVLGNPAIGADPRFKDHAVARRQSRAAHRKRSTWNSASTPPSIG